MDGKLVFSNDGVLRFRTHADDQPAVPLQLIQEALGAEAYPFFIRQLRKTFILEQGSTVGSFLLCLQPWSAAVSDLTDRDVQSYIDEIRKPSAIEPVFNRVEVRKKGGFTREMYHEPMPEGVGFVEWLNRPRGEPVWLDIYRMDMDYDICGYTDGDASNYSLSTNIHGLKNVPLIVNREPIVIAYDREDVGPSLINKEAAGVSVHQREEQSTSDILIAKGVKDEDMTVQDLISVVIEHGLWFNTPQGAINEIEMLKGIMAELPDEDDLEEEEEDKGESESEGMTIEVAPGAFDGMISHYQREKSEWDELLDAVKQIPSSLPLRIGAIEKEDVPTDDRAVGMIFK